MKIKRRITDRLIGELYESGFKMITSAHCPSPFYIKDLGDNKTLYIRRDYEGTSVNRNNIFYSFESWIRDNNKDVSDKTCDTNFRKFIYTNQVEELLKLIKQ